MSSANGHNYPPSNPGSAPVPGIDPQLASYFEAMLQTQLRTMEEGYRQELANREAVWNERESSMKAEIQGLSNSFAASKVQGNRPTSDVNDLNDSNMQSSTPKKTRAAPRNRKPSDPTVSSPSRTLRSQTQSGAPSNRKPTSSAAMETAIPVPPTVAPMKSRPVAKPRAEVVKPSAHIYRLLHSEIPADAGGLQQAIILHVRILWGLPDTKKIPRDPPSSILASFAERFSMETDLYGCRDGPVLISPSLVKIGSSVALNYSSRIANQLRQVEEHMLEYMQASLARFGLTIWCPDFRQSAYSLYNSACRIIALDTFKQALVAHTYAHLKPNTTYAKDMPFLIKLYDNFVHHYMSTRYRKELRNPGSVTAADNASPQYRGRKRLSDARLTFLKENNYPRRYQDLVDPKATSDDEVDEHNSKLYWIRRRPEHSANAETFIRLLDQKRQESANRDPTRRWRERVRQVSVFQRDSPFQILPQGLPIDYFNPTFYNELQPRLRNRTAIRTVALLPNASLSFSRHKDEKLSDKAFTEKYGPDIFPLYDIPDIANEDEEDWVEDFDMNDESDDEDDDEFDDQDDDDMPARRNELTSQLSMQDIL